MPASYGIGEAAFRIPDMGQSNNDLAASRPLVSILLVAYNQERFIADAVRGALAQTWEPTEILISDDASSDGTYAAIESAVRGYQGPHRVTVRRNEINEGISAHLSRLAAMAQGELLFVAAGDDISVPERCERVVRFWRERGGRDDLIATDLTDMDDAGALHGRIAPDDLGTYRSLADWAARRPFLVGAAHAWSRRLFERFGPMMAGAAAEDQIMTFRAIVSGGAVSLREPLVWYRRGGLSGKRTPASVGEMLARFQRGNRFALAEIEQLQRDAETAGVGGAMRAALAAQQARERFIRAMFDAPTFLARLALAAGRYDVKPTLRLRMLLLAGCPQVYAPVLEIKRILRKM